MTGTVEKVELSDIVRFHYGSALKATERDESGPYSVFGSNGPVGRHREQLVDYPTLIVGRKGSVGSIYFAAEGGWPIDTTYYTEIVDPGQVHLRYLYYALRNARLEQHTIVTSIPGLNRDTLYRTKIPLPPLSEQTRVAGILDKADVIRHKRHETARQVASLRRSIFLEMFGDPETNKFRWKPAEFNQLLDGGMRNGISPSRRGTFTGKVLVLSAITGQTFNGTAVKESTFDGPFTNDQLVDADDFLICRGNGNLALVGSGHFPDRSLDDTVFPDTMIAARVEPERLNPKFLDELWGTRHIRAQVESGARTTNGTHKVNQKLLAKVRFPLPPIERQQGFARVVSKIEEVQKRFEPQLSDDLFNSLVQLAFRGEL